MRSDPYNFNTHLFHMFLQLIDLHVSTNIGHHQALMYGSWVIALYLYRWKPMLSGKKVKSKKVKIRTNIKYACAI
jgi:hypothetical protein